jgi:dihydroorotate dehydrogenase
MYKLLVRPILFLFKPETAHYITAALLRIFLSIPGFAAILRRWYTISAPGQVFQKQGLTFPNRVGLAAGFDKDATLYKQLAAFGFGFIEVGTVTPLPQPGNPRPRLFRLPADKALINRMGFNNAGVKAMQQQLSSRKTLPLIGGNIGKNKDTPNENAIQDYLVCLRELHTLVDYFVINVSSPNTPGLRNLQDKGPLKELLEAVQHETRLLGCNKPVLLKIAPDLTDEAIADIAEVVKATGIQGVIATNTSIGREALKTSADIVKAAGAGGLSGKPILEKSTRVISLLRKALGEHLLIIGAGGIHSAADAMEKIKAGADAVQLYTGFIYEGPDLVKQINRTLAQHAEKTKA